LLLLLLLVVAVLLSFLPVCVAHVVLSCQRVWVSVSDWVSVCMCVSVCVCKLLLGLCVCVCVFEITPGEQPGGCVCVSD